jgi:hypothetical protein
MYWEKLYSYPVVITVIFALILYWITLDDIIYYTPPKPQYIYSNPPTVKKYEYLSIKKCKRMNTIINTHFKDFCEKKNKYNIPMDIRKKCADLDICLHWSQWRTEKFTDVHTRIIIWKPLEFLEIELERMRNKYGQK